MIDLALDKNNQLPGLPMGNGRMLAHVFSFVICRHATCPGMGIPCAGTHAHPIGLELGVCDTCRKERKCFLEREQGEGGRRRAWTTVEALAAIKDCAGCGRAAAPAGETLVWLIPGFVPFIQLIHIYSYSLGQLTC